jgi:hypothetical protein
MEPMSGGSQLRRDMDVPALMEGPARFFRRHRGLYAMSVVGALGTATYAVVTARRSAPGASTRWWALAALTGSQAIGMAISYRRAGHAND